MKICKRTTLLLSILGVALTLLGAVMMLVWNIVFWGLMVGVLGLALVLLTIPVYILEYVSN